MMPAATLISRRNRSRAEGSGELQVEYLDGYLATVPEVLGEVYNGGSAAAELPLNLIAIGKCGLD
jgi:hypothetical protein